MRWRSRMSMSVNVCVCKSITKAQQRRNKERNKAMLKVAVCNGSLGPRLIEFLRAGGYQLKEPDRTGSLGTSNGIEFVQVDRRMVPEFVFKGDFDAGITGSDILFSSSCTHMGVLGEFNFSRVGDTPTQWVLAARPGWQSLRGEVRIGCELPSLARRIFPPNNTIITNPFSIVRIEGSEEMCVRHGIVDMALLVTETGASIEACGLEIVKGGLYESRPCLFAKSEACDAASANRQALDNLNLTLQAVVGASQFAMVTFNLPANVDISTLSLPCDTAPTINPTSDPGWVEVTICMPRSKFPDTVGSLKAAGATGIALLPVTGHLA